MIATAMWLRLGIQTDFSLTNTTGIRADIVPGPVDVEQMYNIFPFDNSISKMQLSGKEVQELFDFVARRSTGRACTSQVQIAGSRVVLNCLEQGEGDSSPGVATDIFIGVQACESDNQCASSDCNGGVCRCSNDEACGGRFGSCDTGTGICWQPIEETASYELATSNYLAGGGSGFRVLQRNTTQFDTKIQQRDALIDFIRGGRPCGGAIALELTGGESTLLGCTVDEDCNPLGEGYVCACPEKAEEGPLCASKPEVVCEDSSGAPGPNEGACVLARCRDQVAEFQRALCDRAPTEDSRESCLDAQKPCATGGEQCKFLACLDASLNNVSDSRIRMVGK
jgi:5'-nucleotidase